VTDKRRGHNEGSVYQRADGRWVAAVSLGMVNGKRRRKVVYGETRAEVNKRRTEILHNLNRGIPVQTTSTRLSVFLEEWLASIKPNVRPKTYSNYAMVVREHLTPTLGRFTVDKLSQRHVQELMSAKQRDGLSIRTVLYIRSILRAALNAAMKWDLVARNVATLVDPPQAPRYEPVTLDEPKARQLLAAVTGDHLEALYVVSLLLGLRQAESFGLQWRDVDLEASTLTVRKQLQRIDGQPTFTEPKTSRSKRMIALSPSIAAALKRHRTRQVEERLSAGGRWQAQWDLVFCDTHGSPLYATHVRTHLQGALKRAGLDEMRWHDLRHSAASMPAARGVHPTTAQAILGHATISTTLGVYSHADRAAVHQAVQGMDDMLREAK
jgi:integrase